MRETPKVHKTRKLTLLFAPSLTKCYCKKDFLEALVRTQLSMEDTNKVVFLDQVKELREDFDVPEYCYTSSAEEEGEEEDPDVNIWLGPAGTVSPLHTDPKHNCFCQVWSLIHFFSVHQYYFLCKFLRTVI